MGRERCPVLKLPVTDQQRYARTLSVCVAPAVYVDARACLRPKPRGGAAGATANALACPLAGTTRHVRSMIWEARWAAHWGAGKRFTDKGRYSWATSCCAMLFRWHSLRIKRLHKHGCGLGGSATMSHIEDTERQACWAKHTGKSTAIGCQSIVCLLLGLGDGAPALLWGCFADHCRSQLQFPALEPYQGATNDAMLETCNCLP